MTQQAHALGGVTACLALTGVGDGQVGVASSHDNRGRMPLPQERVFILIRIATFLSKTLKLMLNLQRPKTSWFSAISPSYQPGFSTFIASAYPIDPNRHAKI
jgi:hypothetical protein